MIDFPSNPSLDDIYEYEGKKWRYNGIGWTLVVLSENLAPVAYSNNYNDLSNKPVLADVALSGSYNDLLDKPTDLATEGYVDQTIDQAIADLVDSAPETLDTLNELAAALGDDPNFATTVTNELATKASLDDIADMVTLAGTQTLTNKTLDDINSKVGADHIHFKVKAVAALTRGDVVKVVGFNAGEQALEVNKVSSASDIAVGLMHDTLAAGEFGAVVSNGVLNQINTSAFSVGTVLYPNTTGGLTSTQPTSGTYQAIAYVLRSQSNNGAVIINATEPNFVRAVNKVANTLVIRDSNGNINADLNGNADTVTNGVYTNGSYADPSWITSLSTSKLVGNISGGTY
jgi:hypothetical protein